MIYLYHNYYLAKNHVTKTFNATGYYSVYHVKKKNDYCLEPKVCLFIMARNQLGHKLSGYL